VSDSVSPVLLRVAAELVARSAATKRYLRQLEQGERGEYSQLIATIKSALDRIEAELDATVQGVSASLQAGIDPAQANAVFFAFLQKFSRWFTTVHELLVYLPAQSVKPETLAVLVLSFSDLYHSLKPSLILGSLFNALEFDFQKLVTNQLPDLGSIVFAGSHSIVLQLPICDRESPSSWSILAHELGHAVDITSNLSERASQKFPGAGLGLTVIRSWAREISADLIAACALGPAPILTTISLEYCVYPLISIFSASATHPSTSARLEAVARFLMRRYSEHHLTEEMSLYQDAWNSCLSRVHPNPADQEPFRRAHQDQTKLVLQIADEIETLLEPLSFPPHTTGLESLNRRELRLQQGLPISAQGAPKAQLRSDLAEYTGLAFTSSEHRRLAFQDLTARFKESPMDAAAILTSCQKRRIGLLQDLVAHFAVGKTDGVASFANRLEALEMLISNSINASAVHHRLISEAAVSGIL
jgi:hypothetical protein